MFELMKKRIKNEKGLTLVEVLAVVVILAIVAAIAIPAISNMIEKNRAKALVSDAINVLNAANIYYADGGEENPVLITDLYGDKYLESKGKLDDTTEVSQTPNEPNKITATGTNGNVTLDISDKSLEELTEAKVSVGADGAVVLE